MENPKTRNKKESKPIQQKKSITSNISHPNQKKKKKKRRKMYQSQFRRFDWVILMDCISLKNKKLDFKGYK